MPDDTSHTLSLLLGVPTWDVVSTVKSMVDGRAIPTDERVAASQAEIVRLRVEIADLRRWAESSGVPMPGCIAERKPWSDRLDEIAPDDGPFRARVEKVMSAGGKWEIPAERWAELTAAACESCGNDVVSHGGGVRRVKPKLGWVDGNVVKACSNKCFGVLVSKA